MEEVSELIFELTWVKESVFDLPGVQQYVGQQQRERGEDVERVGQRSTVPPVGHHFAVAPVGFPDQRVRSTRVAAVPD